MKLHQIIPDIDSAAIDSSKEIMKKEIDALPSTCHLIKKKNFSVYYATADQIPEITQEICRLRALFFHIECEEKSVEIHLDQYDHYYFQLFLWNHETSEIVGAYRFTFSDQLIKSRGISSLYISQIYDVSPLFFEKLGPAIELGRAFIRFEYQKNYFPLLLLWYGMGMIINIYPQYKYFYGLVSIDKNISRSSVEQISAFCYKKLFSQDFAQYINPHYKPDIDYKSFTHPNLECFTTLEDLNKELLSVEKDHIPIPNLLIKYFKFNTKIAAIGLHPAFEYCLDLFIITDLSTTDTQNLQKYLGITIDNNFRTA